MLSTSVTATASRKTLPAQPGSATANATGATLVAMPSGQEEVDQQRHEQQLLERGGPLDEGEVGARVLEHHRLVDHRQLEVRRRIVDGNAAGLGDER